MGGKWQPVQKDLSFTLQVGGKGREKENLTGRRRKKFQVVTEADVLKCPNCQETWREGIDKQRIFAKCKYPPLDSSTPIPPQKEDSLVPG